MSLHVLANHMASKGRGGDSMLVHMTPGEVQGLQALAFKMGGSLTINPETGLPEANFLKKMLPILAGAALNFFAPGVGSAIGAAFGASGAVGTGLLVGGVTGLATGSLSKGLMAGLGAYGGAGIGEAFAGAGTSALGTEAYSNALKQGALEGITPPPEALQSIVQDKITSATPWEKMGAGWDAATKSPTSMWDFAKSAKGPLSAAGMSYMAGQEPAKLDIPTATQSPAMIRPMYLDRQRIRPGDPDYRTNEAGSQIEYFRDKYTVPEPYLAGANGGIVALADGGATNEQLSSIGAYLATNPSASDLSAAMQQFGVSQADVDRARSQMAPASNAFTQAQGNQYTIGGAELPQTPNPVLGNGLTEYQQGIVNAGQGVQWGNPQSEAEFVENYYAGSNAYDLTQAERLLGLAPQTMTGAVQNYQLGIGREKELAGRRVAGTDVSSSPYGGFSPARQMAENERNEGIRAGTIPAPAPTPTAAPSPFTVGGVGMAMPHNPNEGMSLGSDFANAQPIPKPSEGVQTLLPPRTEATDLSGTAAGAFVGPRGTVITYDNNGRQTDTGKPASALNDYLTNPQESGVGAFVRGLSWGVSPAEDQKSARALYDYAKSRGLSAEDIVRQSGAESGITSEQLKRQWAGFATQVTPPNQPPPVRVTPIYTPGAPVPGPEIIKPRDPYEPGSPIVRPPPGRAPLPAPATPRNPQLPPDWTGVNRTPIPTRAPAPGIAALTTLTGDPYGLTPTAERFVPPTRTGRSQQIYDYLSGKTQTAPASTRKPIEAKPPAPAPASTESAAPKSPDPAQQPTITGIYDYIQSLGWGDEASMASSVPKLSAEAAKNGWSIEQLSTASGFSVAALQAMFDRYKVSTPPPAASGTPTPESNTRMATGGYLGMAGGGLGSLGGYSDGGQLLRGPGDGVSDDIPAIIGDRQPARLASGEFVIPARIVSELGNGSTEAGARSLYRMMDRVQAGRKKSIGKGKVAVNSRAENYLPA